MSSPLAGCDVFDSKSVDESAAAESEGDAEGSIAVPVLVLEPLQPSTDQPLTATLANEADYGDDVTFAWTWNVDGEPADIDTASVPADRTARDQRWSARLTATSPEDIRVAEVSVTIANSPPELDGAALSADEATRSGTATCTPGTATDADDDELEVSVRWYEVSGGRRALTGDTIVEAGASATRSLDGLFPGDELRCEARAFDDRDISATAVSEPITITNVPPSIESVSVAGDPAPGALLECVAAGVDDADGDAVSVAYAWYVDGALVERAQSSWWIADRIGSVRCEATPEDAWDTGATVSSDPTTVDVDLPAWPGVTLSGGEACQPWVCEAQGTSPDDPVQAVYRWRVDGELVGDDTNTLSAELAPAGASVVCESAPWDGITLDSFDAPEVGPWASSEPRIAPTRTPSADGAEIRDHGRAGDLVRCELTGLTESCGAPEVTYHWSVNGGSLPAETSASFDTSGLTTRDRVQCVAQLAVSEARRATYVSNVLTLSATGYRIHGDRELAYVGRSVDVTDDLDGNEFNEIMIGAPGFARAGAVDAGALYVINGRDDLDVQELSTVRARFETVVESASGNYRVDRSVCREFTSYEGGCPRIRPPGEQDAYIEGPRGAGLGMAVGYAGDIDGDGVGDVIVGAPYQQLDDLWQGRTFVLSGGSLNPRSDDEALSGLPGSGYVFDGECGRRVALDDELAEIDARTAANGDLAGYSVAGLGDVNGDGLGDFGVGAINAGAEDEGIVYVVFGRADGERITAEMIHTRGCGATNDDVFETSDAGFAILGAPASGSARWGTFIDAAGDFDGDGYDDILVHPGGLAGTQSYVVRGGEDLDTVEIGVDGLPRVIPIEAGNFGFRDGAFFGRLISGIPAGGGGDFNGDGYDDLVFHALDVDANTGITVLYGGPTPDAPLHLDSAADGTRGFVVSQAPDLETGVGDATVVGDMNGDGYDDVVVGAPTEDGDRGGAWVVFGGEAPADISLSDIEAGIGGLYLGGEQPGDQLGSAVAGGDVDGDGLDDLLVGVPFATPGDLNQAGMVIVEYGRDFDGAISGFGGRMDDEFTGTATEDRFVGGQGNDLLVGGGGTDVLYGGAGDDVLSVADLQFRRIRGGAGEDTLRFESGCPDPDLRDLSGRVRDIERFEVNGQSFTLAARNIARMSQTSNRLVLTGTSGTVVTPAGDGWVDTGIVETGGLSYYTLVSGWSELWVDTRLNTVMPPSFFTEEIELPENTLTDSMFASVEVSDPDGDDDALTFELTPATTAPVAIDEDTGELRFAAAEPLDYELDARSYDLGVLVTDEDGQSISVVIPLTLTDINEAPFFSSPTVAWSVGEGVAEDVVIGSARAVDVDIDDAVSHTIVSDSSALFAVDETTGDITLRPGASLDFETATSHRLRVRAEDLAGLSNELEIALTVLDRETIARTVPHVFEMRDRSMRGDEPTQTLPSYDGVEAASDGCYTADVVQTEYLTHFSRLWGVEWRFDFVGGTCFTVQAGRTSGRLNADLPATLELTVPDEIVPGVAFSFGADLTVDAESGLLWGETPEIWADVTMYFDEFGLTIGTCDAGTDNCNFLVNTAQDPIGFLEFNDFFGYRGESFALRSLDDDGFRFETPRPVGVDSVPGAYDLRSMLQRLWTGAGLPGTEGTFQVGDPESFGEIYYLLWRPQVTLGLDGDWDVDLEVEAYEATLELENGEVYVWEIGGSPTLNLTPSADANGDGRVGFSLTVVPRVDADIDETEIRTFSLGMRLGEFYYWDLDEAGERSGPPTLIGPLVDTGCGELGICVALETPVRHRFDTRAFRPIRVNGSLDLAE